MDKYGTFSIQRNSDTRRKCGWSINKNGVVQVYYIMIQVLIFLGPEKLIFFFLKKKK